MINLVYIDKSKLVEESKRPFFLLIYNLIRIKNPKKQKK